MFKKYDEDVKVFDKDGKEIGCEDRTEFKKSLKIGAILGTIAIFAAGKLSGRRQGYSDGYKQGYTQGGSDAFNYLDRIGTIANNIKNSEKEKK